MTNLGKGHAGFGYSQKNLKYSQYYKKYYNQFPQGLPKYTTEQVLGIAPTYGHQNTDRFEIPVKTVTPSQTLNFDESNLNQSVFTNNAYTQKTNIAFSNTQNYYKNNPVNNTNNRVINLDELDFQDHSRQATSHPSYQKPTRGIIPAKKFSTINTYPTQSPKEYAGSQLRSFFTESQPRILNSSQGQIKTKQFQDYTQKAIESHARLSGKYYKKNTSSKTSLLRIASVGFFLFSIFAFLFGWNSYNIQKNKTQSGQVAGVSEAATNFKYDEKELADWLLEFKVEKDFQAQEDWDLDGLLNAEELFLKTNPISANTCSETKTDIENLVSLIDPKTCLPFNTESEEDVKRLNEVIHIPTVQSNFSKELQNEESSKTAQPKEDDLLSLFSVKDYNEILKLDENSLQVKAESISQQKETLSKIKKIDEYIKNNRSWEAYDRNYELPVSAAVYYQVSKDYNVPLKYVLAIARLESRFGSDRYDAKGNFTRPGKYQNVYSIGLDDSGNNLGFKTWDDGVVAFGKWYQKFESRGISDCKKWRIYNPNGDYCARVEKLATQIELYLNS